MVVELFIKARATTLQALRFQSSEALNWMTSWRVNHLRRSGSLMTLKAAHEVRVRVIWERECNANS
eukprot:scaffold6814_cov49-Cyclotella_meneghiniana.AAC.4